MLNHDIVIIGAGVSGSAIARELSRYDLDIVVLEKTRGYLFRDFEGKQRNYSRWIRCAGRLFDGIVECGRQRYDGFLE